MTFVTNDRKIIYISHLYDFFYICFSFNRACGCYIIFALYLKCKSFILSAAIVHIVAVSAFARFVSNYIVQFFLFHFSDISSATRKLVVFVIALPSSPSRGSLRFSVPRWRNSFGARKDNVSVDAYMRPNAFQREQWRDNVSRYCWLNSRARELRRPRCRNRTLT